MSDLNQQTISGIVKPHKGNGRKFGYPTANIECPSNLDEGVFVGFTSLNFSEVNYANKPSIIFVGFPETLNETNKRLETHIFDIKDEDLYGAEIEVVIVEKLRNNLKLDSMDELIEQMQQDEKDAREWFKSKT